ncbi:type II toxin-antitoxin system prevent-host-death family antitoxin [Streptomyces sp. NPDC003688]
MSYSSGEASKPVEILSEEGDVELVTAKGFESMEETDYLLRSPANAARLLAAAERVRKRHTLIGGTTEEQPAVVEESDDG